MAFWRISLFGLMPARQSGLIGFNRLWWRLFGQANRQDKFIVSSRRSRLLRAGRFVKIRQCGERVNPALQRGMRIGIHGQIDVGMAREVLRCLGVNAALRQRRYETVPEAVKVCHSPALVFVLDARRLQVQERMTQEIAEFLDQTLHPQGVAVVAEGLHMCAAMRGVKKANARMTTSAMLGTFKESQVTRAEFFDHIGRRPVAF